VQHLQVRLIAAESEIAARQTPDAEFFRRTKRQGFQNFGTADVRATAGFPHDIS
jgi:hypothetical protein